MDTDNKRITMGSPAPIYLDCECGRRLSLPTFGGLPLTYICLCGLEYDRRGNVLGRSW